MNRHQRRTAAKTKTKRDFAPAPAPLPEETPPSAPAAKPGIVLRFFANILLAPWILKRVRHADLERLLAGVAVQAGRPEVAAGLLSRIAQRNEAKR